MHSTLNGGEKNAEHSLGIVTFKPVSQMDPVDLKDTNDLILSFEGYINHQHHLLNCDTE